MCKPYLLLASCLLIVATAFGQTKRKNVAVPNCVSVKGDHLFAAVTELSNFQYKEYLNDIKANGSEELYQRAFPDTNVWNTKLGYNAPYAEYYHKHPAYSGYPVVGVSFVQAQAYCSWLTEQLNTLYASNADSPIKTVVVRLPTEQEWELAARGNLNKYTVYPWGTESLRNDSKKFKGQFMANFKRGRGDYVGVAGNLNDNADVTAPTYAYWPNDIGLYNMSGNVAELVSDQAIAKGGSWRSSGYDVRIASSMPFEGEDYSNDHTGFRYFVEVVEFKPQERKKDIALTAKYIEQSVLLVNNNIYAGQYEVSNRLYAQFTATQVGAKHASKNNGWSAYSQYGIYQQYNNDVAWDNYPVVNITHRDAAAFCAWMTETYNQMPKRKYSKVVFRLPTADEWELAARGGQKNAPYPWGGPYLRNSQGCFLANYCPYEEQFMTSSNPTGETEFVYQEKDSLYGADADGGYFTTSVDSYVPNNLGFYNMSGNAAEMLSDGTTTKGGSWISTSYYIQIESNEEYTGAQPFTGFRYVMEILEE